MEKRGAIVRKRVDQQGFKVGDLSRHFDVDRQTIYRWFDQDNLNVDRIFAIGDFIKWDFAEDFPELSRFSTDAKVLEDSAKMEYKKIPRTANEAKVLLQEAHEAYLRQLSIYTDLTVREAIARR